MAYTFHKDELQSLLRERDAARKKVNEYANLVATLSNELDFLHNNICFTCKWRFSPAQNTSRFTSKPLFRLFRPSRRSPPHVLPSNLGDLDNASTVTTQLTLSSAMSVNEVLPISNTHSISISSESEPTDHTLLPSNQSIPDTSVDSAEAIGMVAPEAENEENERSNNVIYNPQVERKLDLDIAHVFTFNTTVLCANFSPNGKCLAVGLQNGKTCLYSVETCLQMCVLADYSLQPEEETGVWALRFSPNNEYIATGCSDHQIRVWKIEQKRVRAMLKGHTAIISFLVFLPDSRSLISSSYDQSLRIWCTRDGSLKRIINHTSFFFSLSLSQDGRYMTAANADKSLRIWDVKTGRLVMSWMGHSENIWSTVFVPDGKGLLSGSQDKTMKYWDVNLGSTLNVMTDSSGTSASDKSEILTFEGHTSCVNILGVSPDGRWILSGSDDRTIRMWEACTAIWQCTIQGHNNEFVSVAEFSPKGGHLIAGHDSRLLLWRLDS